MQLDLNVDQGYSFIRTVRWEDAPITYIAVTGVTQAAPAVVHVPVHGVPNGWRVAFTSIKGMKQLNAVNSPPALNDYHLATVVDPDHVSLNDVDSSLFGAWTSGGFMQYFTPVDLNGYTALMEVRQFVGGDVLLTLSTANLKIVVDNTGKTITLTLSATDTDVLTFGTGVYDLKMISPAGVATMLLNGAFTVTPRVTV